MPDSGSRSLAAPVRLFLGLACLLAAVLPLEAQSPTQGALGGRIVDSRGNPIPGVTVRLSRPAAGFAPMETLTDADGRYRLFPVPPGEDYLASVDLPGFARVVASPVVVRPGRATNLDLTLVPSREASEVVTVTASGDVIDLAASQTSTRFNSEFLEGLPILGRNYQDVLTLAPGVTDTDGDGNPNVHGARQSGFQTRLDGANITDPYSGSYGQNLNLESIADIEVITTGASAEYGQAQGGFANIITKSGGNEFEGSFKTFFRSDLFDNDGANTKDVDDRELFAGLDGFADLRAFVTLGGPIVRDRLWYFLALERIDLEQPVNTLTQPTLVTEEGWNNFAKLTWQITAKHRLNLQVNHDPRSFGGTNITTRTAPESAYSLERGGYSGSLRWGWTLSPNLLIETMGSWFDTGFGIVPLAEPGPCQPLSVPGRRTNCNRFARDDYTLDIRTGEISGPYYQTVQDQRRRAALRSDVSYYLDGGGGSHSLRGGGEWSDESYRDDVETRPVRFDDFKLCIVPPAGFDDPSSPNFVPYQERQFLCDPSEVGNSTSGSTAVIGSINFEQATPDEIERDADKRNISFYIQDSWRPLPNLTVNLGLRVDREETTVDGWSTFDPAEESARFLQLMALGGGVPVETLDLTTILVHPVLIYDVNGDGLDTLHCTPYDIDGAVFGDGMPDGEPDDFVTLFDGDFDGRVEPDNPEDFYLEAPDGLYDGASYHPNCDIFSDDADTVLSQFSRHQADTVGGVFVNPNQPGDLLAELRTPETFTIANTNPAPRLSVSWDPWKDNRTKLFATWGRYYDRLFLATLVPELGPDPRTEVFVAIDRDDPFAFSAQTGRFSLTQVDRDLQTPYTDELTIGFERELATEWLLGAAYIRRTGTDQLQDVELNHFTQDVNEDGRADDFFGRVGVNLGGCSGGPCPTQNLSDGQPDLFAFNPFLNQVLRIGNFNQSEYTAYQLTLTRRLSHRWQMTTSYVFSRARGNAEEFQSPLGNDPGTVEDEEGPLDYDQRHVAKFAAVGWLPGNQSLGATIIWSSGTPYSVVARRESADNFTSFFFRTTYPTGQRNDSRNEGLWTIDLSWKKSFHFEPLDFAVSAEVDNLLNSDDLVVYRTEPTQLLGIEATRRFGRRWQLGLEFHF